MFHYNSSPRSRDYTSYLPRRSYFPAFLDIDDVASSVYPLQDLGYPSLSQSFMPPRIDAETRYRRALYELEGAEQEYQAHIALERARQATAIRQRAAAGAARRERDIALYAEIERIKGARALEEQLEEGLAHRERAVRTRVPFDRAHRGRHPLMRAIYGAAERDSVPQGHPAGSQPEDETLTIGDLLGLFAGVHPERQRGSPPERPTSCCSSKPHPPVEPHAQPEPPKHENAEVNLSNILEFFRSIAAQAGGAAGEEQSTREQSLPSQPEPSPVDGKGKAKAKAEPVPEPTLFETLFRDRGSVAYDQELRDLEFAIQLSLQDRDASDVKKAQASKTSQSSADASSSKVKVEVPSSLGSAGSRARNVTFASVPATVPEPVSPLTCIRAVRTQFSALESGFKFPPILDFDHSELAATSNNAPVRAYELALSGLLERLDAIESDGDEEVRDVRREVVREVERALEEVERNVKEQALRTPVPEVMKQEASDVESEEPSASATQAILPGVTYVTEVAKPTLAMPALVASQAEADVDLAISAEYQSASPAAGASPANGEADTEAVPASEDASDSITTITPAVVARAVPVPTSSNKTASTLTAGAETFLTPLSYDYFAFPPRPASSQSSAKSHSDDAVVVEHSSEGGSMRSVEDEWTTEFDA